MSEKLSELSSSAIAFRVSTFALAMSLVARFPPEFDELLAGVLALAAAALFYEAWIRRWSRRRLRKNLLWAGLLVAGILILLSGWTQVAATPLFALAAVCALLGIVAQFSERA